MKNIEKLDKEIEKIKNIINLVSNKNINLEELLKERIELKQELSRLKQLELRKQKIEKIKLKCQVGKHII